MLKVRGCVDVAGPRIESGMSDCCHVKSEEIGRTSTALGS
jgi:hypothetical protein